jgi:hypothetical protein
MSTAGMSAFALLVVIALLLTVAAFTHMKSFSQDSRGRHYLSEPSYRP